ncbi:MAG: hypothetical protein A2622_02120 [Bdellovibrionales bacterium RIFCSPHIGHO2_01_FULL_40_29]|nr:MAG: hypothetical protein A2622_02120 [Bdellovibrionales bacterium RIFCSPHIGHO2_01_FULL_40_29]OFZ33884.1 MAG: hypothetical protein A3D17_02540 [Bdellovibrionales bacterium RIFCSPHIGHO2_02_FULL_40_15]
MNRKMLKLAFLNLFRNKRRSLSTGMAICVGFVGLNLLGAYIYRVKRALDTTSVYSALRGHVQIFKKDALVNYAIRPERYSLSPSEISQVSDILKVHASEIEYIGRNLSGSGLLSNGSRSHPVLAFSYEAEVYARSLMQPELLKWANDWVLPSQLENIDIFKQSEDVISITPKIADIMGFQYPLSSQESAQIAARTFTGDLNAVNVELGAEHTTGLQYLEDTIILVPLKKMQELLATENIESFSLYLKSSVSFTELKKQLDRELSQLSFPTETYLYFDEKINAMYVGTLGFLIVMGSFFVFLIGTAVSLTIVNSLTMGIIERTKEIGTLRAVGFRQRDVARIFVLENIQLCLFSIVIGIVITYFIAFIVNALNIQFTPPAVSGKVQFKLGWNLFIAGVITSLVLLLTWISSIIVMRTKLKVKLIDLINDSGA